MHISKKSDQNDFCFDCQPEYKLTYVPNSSHLNSSRVVNSMGKVPPIPLASMTIKDEKECRDDSSTTNISHLRTRTYEATTTGEILSVQFLLAKIRYSNDCRLFGECRR